VQRLTEHLFRHEAGQLLASLTRILGWAHVDLAQDIVQESLLAALRVWPYRGVPRAPRAWLWRVAKNRATDHLRRRARSTRRLEALTRELELRVPDSPGARPRLQDDTLATMFACAHPELSQEAQVALMLRILCGFTTREIAQAYLEPEAVVSQRIVRAKRKLRALKLDPSLPAGDDLSTRVQAVMVALYLLFNEGYSAHSGPRLLRDEFCAEALRLTSALCACPDTDSPAARALLALMYFQSSRLGTRTDDQGNLLLLSEQDRSQWDQRLIALGFAELERAACGTVVSTYHLEAGIAAFHVAAPTYEDTDWMQILMLYDRLVERTDSPIVALNRAVALGMVRGHRAALKEIERLGRDTRFGRYHLYHSTLAEFNSRAGHSAEARRHFEQAIALAGTEPERRFLERRLSDLSA
jgi:RNA polymerase sigma-70 factor (ECF subfamily)